MGGASGIHDLAITDLPLAIVDLETTGLSSNLGDKIVEIAIVRVEPDGSNRLVLDSLVNPSRRVSGTWIHGITDEDVVDAPTFPELAGEIVQALDSCVLTSYNVYFDAGFLQSELSLCGVGTIPPHFCLMYMRQLLGIGKKCCLEDACKEFGIPTGATHQASVDALLGLKLWEAYRKELEGRGIRTYGDLSKVRKYKYNASFSNPLLQKENHEFQSNERGTKQRGSATKEDFKQATRAYYDRKSTIREYLDSMTAAIADDCITRDEIASLLAKQKELSLNRDDLRWVHACAFNTVLRNLSMDKTIDDGDSTTLSDLASALRALGWTPGDSVVAPPVTTLPRPERIDITPPGKSPSLWSRLFGL